MSGKQDAEQASTVPNTKDNFFASYRVGANLLKSIMKALKASRYYLLHLTLSLSGIISAQQGWMGGAGPSLAFEQEIFGVNARLYYGPNETFCFGPEVTVFPYQGVAEGYEISLVDLNMNAHYIFELSHAVGVYPLAGFNYSLERERLILDKDEIEKENATGLNYGFGIHFNLNHLFLFSEFKGVTGALNDQFVTAGIIFSLFKPDSINTH